MNGPLPVWLSILTAVWLAVSAVWFVVSVAYFFYKGTHGG